MTKSSTTGASTDVQPPFVTPRKSLLIYLLRHAEAEDRSPTGLDADRRLTEAGVKRARVAGRALARLPQKPERMIVSPLVRARQTSEVVAETIGFRGRAVESASLLPSADPEAILLELRKHPHASVLLVGHEPHMGRLFGRLLTGAGDVEVPMRKASLAAFDAGDDPSSGSAELLLYLPAKVSERLS